jgi:hypothetical protein
MQKSKKNLFIFYVLQSNKNVLLVFLIHAVICVVVWVKFAISQHTMKCFYFHNIMVNQLLGEVDILLKNDVTLVHSVREYFLVC